MTRVSYLVMSDFELLEEWCRSVRTAFRAMPYLVGSVLERKDYRDVDVRVMLPDAAFDRLFAHRKEQVRLVNRAVSIWGQRETGLPVDFQVQRVTEANAQFGGTRIPMGSRDWSRIATSGVPE